MTALLDKANFTLKDYFHQTINLTFPAMAERLLLTLVGMVSSVILGKTVGAKALSAVAISTTFVEILQGIFIGLGLGAAILIAREGQDNKELTKKITINSLYLNGAAGLVLGVFCFIFCKGIMSAMFKTTDKAIVDMSVTYLSIVLLFMPVAAIDISVSSCLRGAKDAKTPFYITAAVNVINAALCFLFIGALHMTVKGAALSYAISTFLGCIFRLLLLFKGNAIIHIERLEKIDYLLLKRIFKISVPSICEQFFVRTAFLGMQAVTALIDTAALAGYQVANNVIKLTYCLTAGFETAQITLVGNSLGKRKKEQALAYSYGILYFAEAVCILYAVFMFICAKPLCGIFLSSKDAITLDTSSVILRILCFTVPLTTFYQGCQGTLKAGGAASTIIVWNIVGPWVIRIPIAFSMIKLIESGALYNTFYPYLSNLPFAQTVLTSGITGLMLGFFTDYTARSIAYGIRLLKGKWLYSSL